MIKALIHFYGDREDQYGMPIPYHGYYIIAGPWNKPNYGTATVVTFPQGTENLNPPTILVSSGGEDAAFQEMLSKLRSLKDNHGLHELITKE